MRIRRALRTYTLSSALACGIVIASPSAEQSPSERLLDAAARSDIENAKASLANGADINAKDSAQRTALHVAGTTGNRPLWDFLVSRGADTNATDFFGDKPLQGPHTPLLAPRADSLEEDLVAAAEKGDLNKVRAAVKQGARVDARTEGKYYRGRTALHLACIGAIVAPDSTAHVSIVRYLLQNGADVNARDGEGATPLHSAVSAMGDYKEPRRAEKMAPCKRIVFLLLDEGADPTILRIGQETPLHVAAAFSDEETVRALLKHGAQPDAARYDSCRPAHMAAWFGRPEIVRLLGANGADLEAKCNLGTPNEMLRKRQDQKSEQPPERDK
jgi:ankyrin repeat protein